MDLGPFCAALEVDGDSFLLHARIHRLARESHRAMARLLENDAWTARREGCRKRWLDAVPAGVDPQQRRKLLAAAIRKEGRKPRAVDAMDGEIDVVVAAALGVLDEVHADALWQRSGVEVRLDERSDVLILGPEATVLQGLVPSKEGVLRESSDFDSTTLDLNLRCRLVPLEVSAAQHVQHQMLDGCVDDELRRRFYDNGKLRIGLCSPFGDCSFRVSVGAKTNAKGQRLYQFQSLGPGCEQRAIAELRTLLKKAFEQQLDILCFPELTIDGTLLGELKTQLAVNRGRRPALVMAGSFHQPRDERVVNRSLLLDGRGNTVGAQHKIGAYAIDEAGMRNMPKPMRVLFGDAHSGICENIGCDASPPLMLWESSLGRLATPICRDFFDDSLTRLFKASGANWFLVPSMTPSLTKFATCARDLGHHTRACVLLANSLWLLKQLEFDKGRWHGLLSLVYLPTRNQATAEEVASGLRVIDICKALAARRQ